MNAEGASWRAPDVMLLAVGALVVAAGLAVGVSGPRAEQVAAAQEMQAALGGLGLGRAVDASRCAGAFDARLGAACEVRHHPLSLPDWVCPDHAFPLDVAR